jgi:hypothetical protein
MINWLNDYFYYISTSWLLLNFFSFLWRYSPNLGLGLPPWNSPFHFGFLHLRQPVGLLGRVISSSQGMYLYTNTEKRTHTHRNTKHPCPEWDSNPLSRLPSERRQPTVLATKINAIINDWKVKIHTGMHMIFTCALSHWLLYPDKSHQAKKIGFVITLVF